VILILELSLTNSQRRPSVSAVTACFDALYMKNGCSIGAIVCPKTLQRNKIIRFYKPYIKLHENCKSIAKLVKKFLKVHSHVHKGPPLYSILARWNQFTLLYLVSLVSTLIFSSHLQLSLPSVVFPSGFLTKILHAFLIPLVSAALAISSFLVLINLIFSEE